MRLVALTCASCGADVSVDQEQDRFFCKYCRAPNYIERSGDELIARGFEAIRAGTDKTAAELALVRLKAELADLEVRIREWTYRPQMPIFPRPPPESADEPSLLDRMFASKKELMHERQQKFEVRTRQRAAWHAYDAAEIAYQRYRPMVEQLERQHRQTIEAIQANRRIVNDFKPHPGG